MTDEEMRVAQACQDGAASGTMSFPEIVGTLIAAGFEGYAIDFRRTRATYFKPGGEGIDLAAHPVATPVAAVFDAAAVAAAVREAQASAPGYTYAGFCEKIAAAGCAGYIVSFLGRRVLYLGRTADTHAEHFPD